MATERKFAVFDIDGTLFRWQLYHAIVFELVELGVTTPREAEELTVIHKNWRDRKATFHEYEQAVVALTKKHIKGLPVKKFEQAAQKVFDNSSDQVYRYTRDLVKDLKSQGYILLAISGSFEEIVSLFARKHGFDDWEASVCERDGGKFTGKVRWMYDSGKSLKIDLLNELVKKHGLSFKGSIGVGDSSGDIEMLSMVENPIAFNPDTRLLNEARKNGWQIVVERKDVIYKLSRDGHSYILA